MSQPPAKTRYQGKCHHVKVSFYLSAADQELYAHVDKHPSKQAYIKDLIRADMARGTSPKDDAK